VLGGNPYTNRATLFPVNGILGAGLNELVAYETTGNLNKPLLLHNTGNPIVPYWHTQLYAAKVPAGREFSIQTSDSHGHCSFTQDEIMAAFQHIGRIPDQRHHGHCRQAADFRKTRRIPAVHDPARQDQPGPHIRHSLKLRTG